MTDEAWGAVMALPSEERDLVRYCTLGADDLDRLRALRVAHNHLGHALLLCAMRHPGRPLAPGERPPAAMVAWVTRQLGVDPPNRRQYQAATDRCSGIEPAQSESQSNVQETRSGSDPARVCALWPDQ